MSCFGKVSERSMCRKSKSDISNEFAVTVWDKMNVCLAIATAITTLTFVVLFVLCFVEKLGEDCLGMILGMCGVFASLASAFAIAWVMRFYDLIKKREQELKALELARPYLSSILTVINEFFPQLRDFATISDEDKIKYPSGTIYYKKPAAKVLSRSFINLNEAFGDSYSQLNHELTECLNAPILYQCNQSVVELLTGLKLNGLTHNLFEIYKASSDALFADSSYMGLYKNYVEFLQYYETLATITKSSPAEKFVILSEKEQQIYIKEIETIKKQLQIKHTGRIYKGYDRIQ